ncbi:MAG TPA: hypothetical protein VJ023_13060 [Pyrinomonadaceae bacterium]|nr:hypothetical protein [Pyrinomonadaceae bacterium]
MKSILVIIIYLITSIVAFGSEVRGQDAAEQPEQISFPTQDGGLIYANLYGTTERSVVLAHGGRFNKDSWEKQTRILVRGSARPLILTGCTLARSSWTPITKRLKSGNWNLCLRERHRERALIVRLGRTGIDLLWRAQFASFSNWTRGATFNNDMWKDSRSPQLTRVRR